MKKPIVIPAALALALAAAPALSVPGFAQAAATPAPTTQAPSSQQPAIGPAPWDQQQSQRHHDRMQGQRGEHRFDFAARAAARIAYVKTELKITPAQEPAFDRYAQVIRDHATVTQKAFEDLRAHRGQNTSAIDRVEQRAKFAQDRDQYEQQYLAAFRPLYASLSPDQKKVADQLATPHFGHHGRDHHDGPRRG